MIYLVLAIPLALMMGLVGFISAHSFRRSVILLLLCVVWLALGLVCWPLDHHLPAALVSFAQALAGFTVWMATVVRRASEAAGSPPSESSPSSPPR